MKRNTTRKIIAFGIGIGILVLTIILRFMGVAPPVLLLLGIASLAVFVFAFIVRGEPGPQP